jgi:hypothetical protein
MANYCLFMSLSFGSYESNFAAKIKTVITIIKQKNDEE